MSDRRRPSFHDGVPCCSHMVCPKFDGKRCKELGYQPDGVCVPEVRAMAADKARMLPVYEAAKEWRGHLDYSIDSDVDRDLMVVVDAALASEHV